MAEVWQSIIFNEHPLMQEQKEPRDDECGSPGPLGTWRPSGHCVDTHVTLEAGRTNCRYCIACLAGCREGGLGLGGRTLQQSGL